VKETTKRDLTVGLVSLVGVGIIIGMIVLTTWPWVGGRVFVPELISLNVSPTEVEPGETVIVTMEFRNVGKEKGTWVLELLINGVAEQSKLVTLDVGQTRSILFFVKKDIEGSYSVELCGLTGTFVVIKPEPPT